MKPHSCEHCQRLVLTTDPVFPGTLLRDQHFGLNLQDVCSSAGIPKSHNPASVFQSCYDIHGSTLRVFDETNDCPLFRRLLRKFLEQSEAPNQVNWFHEPAEWELIGGVVDKSGTNELFLVFQMASVKETSTALSRSINLIAFYMYAEDVGDCASSLVSTRPISFSPSSSETFEYARKALSDCLTFHQHASLGDSPFRPTRLIHIQRRRQDEASFDLELISGFDRDAKQRGYVALSYCWGGDQLHKLTKKKQGSKLNFDDLPRTIRDTITVTWELGYHQLWIDSMCICQDDPEEMTREIAQMPLVYSNAVITIAASTSSKVTEGFSQERENCGVIGGLIETPYQNSKGERGIIGLVEIEIGVMDQIEPLDTRAWTLQEYLLSPRILDCGTFQTRFICEEELYPSRIDGWVRHSKRLQLIGRGSKTEAPLQWTWARLIEKYTRRRLTVATDRILGIAAMASTLQSLARDDVYLAGYWLSMLPLHLLWRVKPQPPPDHYQGPSWSWTGVNGEVTSFGGIEYSLGLRESTASVVGHAITLVNDAAPYGAVKEATLIIRGRVRFISDISLIYTTLGPLDVEDEHLLSVYTQDQRDEWNEQLRVQFDTDAYTELVHHVSLHALEIGKLRKSWHYGLLLQEQPSFGKLRRFSRLGIYRVQDASFDTPFLTKDAWEWHDIELV